MHDDAMTPNDPGFADIARRLEAFSDLRLTPSAETAARMRAEVMIVAYRRTAGASLGAAAEPAAQPSIASSAVRRRSSAYGFGWHRPFAVVVAAALALGAMTGTTYAARAGGPLYETRVWMETLTLPSDDLARASAEVRRIEERLLEAQSAMAVGDAAGTMAALAAYTEIVAEATAASDGDAAASDIIELGVGRQLAVLAKLAGVVPIEARAAIEHALASSTKALDHLGADVPAGPDGKGPAGGSGAGPAKSGAGGSSPSHEAGNGSGEPARSPKPSSEPASVPKGPKADPTAEDKGKDAASPTPRPAPTPRAAPTPKVPPSPGKP